MKGYLLLGLAALLPVIVAVIIHLAEHKWHLFDTWKYWQKQLLFGVVFGGLAVLGTEWGVPINGAQCNCRDAAVVTAGLFFGAPAGILAGIIGGIERWVAVAWGVGSITRIACSLSTVLAGFYAALVRKILFKNRRPSWLIGMAAGVVIEVFHMLMVFITNIGDPILAMSIVKACSFPMITANGLSVMFTGICFAVMDRKEQPLSKGRKAHVAVVIQRWMLVAVSFAFLITSFFVYRLQTSLADSQTESLLRLANDEVITDLTHAETPSDVSTVFGLIRNRHVGESGFTAVFDRKANPLSLPEGMTVSRRTFDFSLIADEDVPADPYYSSSHTMAAPEENVVFTGSINGEPHYCMLAREGDYVILSAQPVEEALYSRDIALFINIFLEILVFAFLFGQIFQLISHSVVDPLASVTGSLHAIADGDLDVAVDVHTSAEFVDLSQDINKTVNTLKTYIDEASKLMDKELEMAKNIQVSALPCVFPAFPKRHDFDIYASMRPAKEVGGDFYDFYLNGTDKLNFLVADVSGKGVPAAMFMMRAKTELKALTESGLSIGEVFAAGNNGLCEGNDAGMFVTAWQGCLDLTTGCVSFANAGHNPPLVKRKDGKFEFLKSRAGLVLAGMEDTPYRTQELQLQPGDVIFLYTDGVTEATDANTELFGEKRLLEALNSREFPNMQSLCNFIGKAVDSFVGDAPQFDDITMVALRYIGALPTPTITFKQATLQDIPVLTDFVETELEKLSCPMKYIMQFSVAIDEIYSNIVRYGYAGTTGPVEVKIIREEDPDAICLCFTDSAIPYNPLTKADPDVTLSAEDRSIGGLGIYMVKKTMDDLKYKYENDQNILTIIKKL